MTAANAPAHTHPYRRACADCGEYEDYEMDDRSWICHACGTVTFPAAASSVPSQPETKGVTG